MIARCDRHSSIDGGGYALAAAGATLKYAGSLPGYHLMLHPMLGRWLSDGDLPASTASMAARRSAPLTGTLFFGRLPSNWPRYARRPLPSKRKKSGVQAALNALATF